MTLKQWLQDKKVTVALSAGFFGFYSHAGFLAALLEEGIAPAKITGASAGAIVAALYASGYSIEEMQKILYQIRKDDFWDPGLGLGLLKGHKFENLLKDHLEDDFDKLKVPVAISAFDLKTLRTKVYNQDASLVKAVLGSSALPPLFRPVKYQNALLSDGGIADEWALKSTAKDDYVLCHYLPRGSKVKFDESIRLNRKRSSQRKVLAFHGKVFVGPHALEKGPLAFEHAYLKTKEFLSLEA